ncbi:hypothetical protein NL328_27500, partial [Klebsiella pneumoniae]|nr:hypothetical protein [Klebsiella pneumoniae]
GALLRWGGRGLRNAAVAEPVQRPSGWRCLSSSPERIRKKACARHSIGAWRQPAIMSLPRPYHYGMSEFQVYMVGGAVRDRLLG